MSKFPDKRTGADHLKAGLKNIKDTYKALYNHPSAGSKTAAQNAKAIVTGRHNGQPVPAKTRAAVAAKGVASVTPVGPIAAFAAGVKKSIQEKKEGRAIRAVINETRAQIKASEFKKAAPKAERPSTAPTIGVKLPAAPKAPAASAPKGPTVRVKGRATVPEGMKAPPRAPHKILDTLKAKAADSASPVPRRPAPVRKSGT